MDTPAAEVAIDTELVHALLLAQHPSLLDELSLVDNGWDNAIYRLGGDYAVRLPRRAVAVPLIEHEQRWLASIAERMPVAIPTPLAVGIPSLVYPWPWSIVRWFDGTPVDELDMGHRDHLARDLAAAVSALHIPAPADAPRNRVRGVALRDRDAAVQSRLAASSWGQALRDIWEKGLAAPVYAGPPLWLHGDLHPANAIAADGKLTALIDFGDLCAGDPACDLAAAWLFFGAEGRHRFRASLAYDNPTWVRARAWAASFALAFAGASAGSKRMADIAAHALEQLTEG